MPRRTDVSQFSVCLRTRFCRAKTPSCGALLVRHAYQKEGINKIMLRCSLLENRRGKCKEVAFFQGREGFWSPKFGNLNEVESL